MDYINRSILKNLKSGQYFIDAINWYERKYIFPFTERAILVVISCMFMLASIIIMKYADETLPLKKEISFPLLSRNIDSEIPIIKPLAVKGEKVTYSLAKYLLSNYVIMRESYDNAEIPLKLEFVKQNSSRNVYSEYAKTLDLSNIDSLVYKYQDSVIRKIEIISVENNKDLSKINILFTAKMVNSLNTVIEESRWRAEINFILTDIEKEKSDKLNFLVDEYKVTKIE